MGHGYPPIQRPYKPHDQYRVDDQARGGPRLSSHFIHPARAQRMITCGHGWQRGQYDVPRPPTTVRSRNVPQRGQGDLPPRP